MPDERQLGEQLANLILDAEAVAAQQLGVDQGGLRRTTQVRYRRRRAVGTPDEPTIKYVVRAWPTADTSFEALRYYVTGGPLLGAQDFTDAIEDNIPNLTLGSGQDVVDLDGTVEDAFVVVSDDDSFLEVDKLWTDRLSEEIYDRCYTIIGQGDRIGNGQIYRNIEQDLYTGGNFVLDDGDTILAPGLTLQHAIVPSIIPYNNFLESYSAAGPVPMHRNGLSYNLQDTRIVVDLGDIAGPNEGTDDNEYSFNSSYYYAHTIFGSSDGEWAFWIDQEVETSGIFVDGGTEPGIDITVDKNVQKFYASNGQGTNIELDNRKTISSFVDFFTTPLPPDPETAVGQSYTVFFDDNSLEPNYPLAARLVGESIFNTSSSADEWQQHFFITGGRSDTADPFWDELNGMRVVVITNRDGIDGPATRYFGTVQSHTKDMVPYNGAPFTWQNFMRYNLTSITIMIEEVDTIVFDSRFFPFMENTISIHTDNGGAFCCPALSRGIDTSFLNIETNGSNFDIYIVQRPFSNTGGTPFPLLINGGEGVVDHWILDTSTGQVTQQPNIFTEVTGADFFEIDTVSGAKYAPSVTVVPNIDGTVIACDDGEEGGGET